MRVVTLAVLGAAGALSRYGISSAIGTRLYPWGTLGINVAGSFLLGLLLAPAMHRHVPEWLALPLAVGFLGAFTTFSTFSVETAGLLRAGRATAALSYVLASVVVGLVAALAGHQLGESLG